jgi:glycosyltransferase involved in cell wall biosynthesis
MIKYKNNYYYNDIAINPIINYYLNNNVWNCEKDQEDYNKNLLEKIKNISNKKFNKKISIMIITQNREKMLKNCLNSIFLQTYKDFEIILIDDRSIDNTENLCYEFKQKYPEKFFYYKNNDNITLGKLRNKALDKCNGEYIAIIDSDDIAVQNRIETQIYFLDKNKYLGFVSSDAFHINEDGIPTGIIFNISKQTYAKTYKEKMKLQHLLLNTTIMYRHNVLLRFSGFENYDILEDFGMIAKIIMLYDYENISYPLMFYRRHANNTSKVKLKENFGLHKIIIENIKKLHYLEGINYEGYN